MARSKRRTQVIFSVFIPVGAGVRQHKTSTIRELSNPSDKSGFPHLRTNAKPKKHYVVFFCVVRIS